MIDINSITIGELKELQSLVGNKNECSNSHHPFKIGQNYLVRTVTMIVTGKLVAVFDTELVFETASWIADTGRFNEALKKGLLADSSSEIEPSDHPVIVGRGSIIDMYEYHHELPTKTK
jgi:hypothetical protein